jgi:hypothetical protein
MYNNLIEGCHWNTVLKGTLNVKVKKKTLFCKRLSVALHVSAYVYSLDTMVTGRQ